MNLFEIIFNTPCAFSLQVERPMNQHLIAVDCGMAALICDGVDGFDDMKNRCETARTLFFGLESKYNDLPFFANTTMLCEVSQVANKQEICEKSAKKMDRPESWSKN